MTSKCRISWTRSALIAGATLLSVGCKLADGGATSLLPPDQFFAVLALEQHAINLSLMAPYDTVTLNTVAMMADGSAVPDEITYSVSNPAIRVTGGILKADSAIARAVVRVILTHGTVTRTDSAIVSVIATAPPHLSDFGLRLSATDSAKVSAGDTKTIPLIRQSQSGANLSGLHVFVRSSDTTIAKITQSGDDVNITSIRPGRVVLYASTLAFGIAQNDSLVFTVGWPLFFRSPIAERFATGSVAAVLDFGYRDFTIGVGGCVVWINMNVTTDIDLQFDDPSHVGAPGGTVCPETFQIQDPDVGGNIAPFHRIPWDGNFEHYASAFLSPYRARTFSAPGIFTYSTSIHGTTGMVRVCDERNDTTCAPRGIGAWY